MRLRSLTLSNVRNYAHLEMEPAPGLNVFVGKNAQGKSNLLEAIALLGTGKSFRTSRERDLIRDGFEIASIAGEAAVRSGALRLSCSVTAGARGTRKLYAVNGHAVRYAGFLGSLRVVTFVPADLYLAAGPPSGRRAFLNVALAQEDRSYYHALARYHKVVAQKSALLRQPSGPDQHLLDVYDETIVQAGTAITLARAAFTLALASVARRVHQDWSAGAEELQIAYAPNVAAESPTADAVSAALRDRLEASRTAERQRGTALVGPHRDDVSFSLDGRPLAAYGSQGQQRTAVLALKVAEYSVMQQRSSEAPLLLLDDVLSELDEDRARAFIAGIGSFEQAFVTATHLPEALPPAAVHTVESGRIR